VRPYDLRHSFVSLLLAEGANVVEIARQAGHSPTMTLSSRPPLRRGRRGGQRVSAEDEIGVRDTLYARSDVPDSYPKSRASFSCGKKKALQIKKSRRPDSNRGPLHYE
jgi:transposase-like protein